MNAEHESFKEILAEAAAKASPAERAAYLDGACRADPGLRARVEALLRVHDQAGGFLEDPVVTLPQETIALSLPVTEKAGDRIGRYKLLQQIGEGGCGVVYMAEQEEPVRRRVALKVIKLGMDTKSVIARFEAERQALALMDHPNIAKVLDAGATETGRPYFVMELVRGIKITDYCDEHSLATRERLDLFIQVCHAIQHAHQKGIIHRDIKPSNILVTVNEGVPVPKVIDFGIAKATEQRLTDRTLFTAFEQFLGTPAYMSPEQATMTSLDIDTRSDIYALGVLLYELLTGKTPFDARTLVGAGLQEMRRIIREQEPVRPSTRLSTMADGELSTTAKHRMSDAPKLVTLIRGDLDWIVMKALEKDRTRRYETANGLARDVQRHLSNEPVVARPPSAAYRAQKFVRRNKVMVVAAGAVAVAVLLGALVSTWLAVRATTARRLADSARQEAVQAKQNEAAQHQQADAARDHADQALYAADLNLAQQDYETGNLGRMSRLLDETRNNPGLGFEWFYWQRRIHRDLHTFRGHTWVLRGVAISPDGRLVATASMDGTGRLWEATTGRELRTFGSWGGECRTVSFSRDGGQLAIGGGQKVILWDIAQQRERVVITNTSLGLVGAAALSPDGTQVAMGGWSAPEQGFLGGPSSVWDASTGEKLRELNDGVDVCLEYSPDGQKLLTAGVEGVARIWDARTGKRLLVLDAQGGGIWGGGFSPDGQRIVTAHWDGVVRVWRVADGARERELNARAGVVQCALYSPQGDRVYSAGFDQKISVWNAATGEALPSLPRGHTSPIVAMAISGDGQRLLTGSWNGEAKLWDTRQTDGPRTFSARLWPEDPSVIARFWGELRGPTAFLSASEQGLIVAPNTNHSVIVWDFATHRELLVLKGHDHRISAVAVSPDQQRIAAGSTNGTFILWDARDGRTLVSLRETTNRINLISFSPDNRGVLFVGPEGVVRVCDLAAQPRVKLTVSANASTAAYSPDGKGIATVGQDHTITLWNAATGRAAPVKPMKGSEGVSSLCWSPDGRRLALAIGDISGRTDLSARVWDVSSGSIIAECRGHTLPTWCIAFSADGNRLVTGSMDKTAKVWEVASGRELLTLKGHGNDLHAVGFSAEGRCIVTSSDDQTIKVWEAASAEQVANWHQEEQEANPRIEKLRNERDRANEQEADRGVPKSR